MLSPHIGYVWRFDPGSDAYKETGHWSWRIAPDVLDAKNRARGDPIAKERLCHALAQAGYPADRTKELYDGFTYGFDLGIGQSGTYPAPGACRNPPPLSAEALVRVRTHLLREVAVGRRLGPFPGKPNGSFWTGARQSPMSEIPKGDPVDGKFRLIFNLSYGGSRSVNASIPEELGAVIYPTFEDTVRAINAIGVEKIFLGLHDIVDAFRHLPIAHRFWKFLISSWPGPDGSEQYFVDTHLCFGVRTGPAIYAKLGAALEFLLIRMCMAGAILLRMADDHLFMANSAELLEGMMWKAENIFKFFNVPWSLPKRVGATKACKYLGYWWDTANDLVSARDLRDILAEPTLVGGFIAALALEGVDAGTASGYLDGVRHFATDLEGHPAQARDPAVTLILRGMRASQPAAEREQPTIRLDALRAMVAAIPSMGLPPMDAAALEAAMCLAYFGALRVSEYLVSGDRAKLLARGDVTFSPDGQSMTVVLKKTKTNQVGPPQMVTIPARAGSALASTVCPVAAAQRYLALHDARFHADPAKPFFGRAAGVALTWAFPCALV